MLPNLTPSRRFDSSATGRFDKVPYTRMVELLGPPTHPNPNNPGDKVDVEWYFVTSSGSKIAFWNYKNGPNYLGSPVTLDQITSWSFYAPSPSGLDFIESQIVDSSGGHLRY